MQSRFDNQMKFLEIFPILLNSHHNLAQVGGKLIIDAPEALGVSHIRDLDQGLLYRWMEHSFLTKIQNHISEKTRKKILLLYGKISR